MTRPGGSLSRSAESLTLGLVRKLAQLEAEYDEIGLRQANQNFQIDVKGEASSGFGWTWMDLDFIFPFSYAPLRNESDIVFPHFTYGTYFPLEDEETGEPLDGDDNTPAGVFAVVSHYYRDADSDKFTGARVYFGIGAASTEIAVAASVHLTFQGFVTSDEEEDDLD